MTDIRYDTPDLGAPVPDTHAHLDMLDDPPGALVRAAQSGVSFVATVVDVTESPERTFEGLAGWCAEAEERLVAEAATEGGHAAAEVPGVRIVVGCHPHNASRYDEAVDAHLRAYARDPRVAAIGEMGLDFHYDNSPRDDQRASFRAELAIAHESGLPAVVHLREAHDEGIEILTELGVPRAGCIIHCFTADATLARRFVDMGCYVSFAGPLTFKKAEELRVAAAAVPLERLLVETDCPFLAPDPYRGKRNEPALVTYTAAALARTHGVDTRQCADTLTANAQAVFGGARS